ncbi:hypothetical protein ABIF07_000256 [Bradyrhizobium elkanii]|nr:hypothetical protein [Bradyrhizobium elkanii]MCS3695058.1 hypothetical protein [Bradyrhizobium elkanii]
MNELFDRYKRGDEETIWKLKEIEAAGDIAKISTKRSGCSNTRGL